jgi:DNA-binding IclR family transcriptional regulator
MKTGIIARHERILNQLRKGEESASNLALIIDCPTASIRRSVAQLRALGHNISFSGDGSSELYRLGE